jgi:glycine cleavage system H protein
MYPADYRYTKDHEWIKIDGSVGTIGITDYAQHELGDVVFVELPKVGARIKAGESFGSVESVKAVSDIFSPVSGEITEINSALTDAPEKINHDPHGSAWLVRMKLDNASEANSLMDAKAYQTYVDEKAQEQSA